MHILITNDDGYLAQGISALRNALMSLDFVDITTIAPAQEQSASSHSLSINSPLTPVKFGDNSFYIKDGRPADCVFVGIYEILKDKKIDLIISGINHGCNLGEDISYSGTVGAAIEGVLHDVPSIAISQFYNKNKDISFDTASKVIVDIVQKIHLQKFPLPERKLLNINIPDIDYDNLNGYEITRAGHKLYVGFASVHTNYNPREQKYYWLGLNHIEFKKDTNAIISDYEAIKANKVSITPVKVDMTDLDEINHLKQWIAIKA